MGIESSSSNVRAPCELAVTGGCWEVSVETCGAKGRQRSLGKCYNRSLGHFRRKTMDPIVTSPLTFATFSTNESCWNVVFLAVRVELTGLFKSVYSSVCVGTPGATVHGLCGRLLETAMQQNKQLIWPPDVQHELTWLWLTGAVSNDTRIYAKLGRRDELALIFGNSFKQWIQNVVRTKSSHFPPCHPNQLHH